MDNSQQQTQPAAAAGTAASADATRESSSSSPARFPTAASRARRYYHRRRTSEPPPEVATSWLLAPQQSPAQGQQQQQTPRAGNNNSVATSFMTSDHHPNNNHNKSRSCTDRRLLMERAQSTNNVLTPSSAGARLSSYNNNRRSTTLGGVNTTTATGSSSTTPFARSPSFRITDISSFQDSWATASWTAAAAGGGAGGGGDGASTLDGWGSTTSLLTCNTANTNSVVAAAATAAPNHPPSLLLQHHETQQQLGGSNRSLLSGGTTTTANTAATPPFLCSAIHDAARIFDWDTVLKLCLELHPHAADYAAYAGRDGWTALHHACGRRCPRPDVVQALIDACHTTTTCNSHNSSCFCSPLQQAEPENAWLPLHLACRFKAPAAVVQLLVQAYPAAVSCRDRLGRTPLFLAVRYDAPPGVLELLLRQDASVVLQSTSPATSPLALVWDSWAEKTAGKRIVHSFLPAGFEEGPPDCSPQERAVLLRQRLQQETKLLKRWNMANLLLKAAFGFSITENNENNETENDGPDEEETKNETKDEPEEKTTANATDNNNKKKKRKWRIVHATAAIKCHLSLFLLACALHPEQVLELDEHDLQRPGDDDSGCTAAVTTTTDTTTTDGATDSSNNNNNNTGPFQTALHLAASSAADGETGKAVILTLLSLYRGAAEVPDGIDGSLPLHRLVETAAKCYSHENDNRNGSADNWSQHAALLYHFYPRAVQVSDWKGRLPLHRAAAALHQMLPATTVNHAQIDEEDDNDDNDDNNQEQQQQEQPPPDNHEDDTNNEDDTQQQQQQRSVMIQLLRAFPQAASRPDATGHLPLHLAAASARVWNTAVMDALVETHPAALRARTHQNGNLPLHLATANAVNHADSSLICSLLRLHPAAAAIPDGRHGRYPLHLLAASAGGDSTSSALAAAVRSLHEAFPAAIRRLDGGGRWLPLHLACGAAAVDQQQEEAAAAAETTTRTTRSAAASSSSSVQQQHHDTNDHHHPLEQQQEQEEDDVSLIPQLLALYPAAASIADPLTKRYPLHLACAAGRPWRDLQHLLHADATIAATADRQGQVPFVAAALRYCRGHNDNDDADTTMTQPQASPRHHHHHEQPSPPKRRMGDDNDNTNTINEPEAAELDILFQLLRADPTILP